MTEYSYEIKIPKERVAVLIGKKGCVKKQIEEETKTKIKVDSEEGEVTVLGEDAVNLYTTRELIKAIGRGFNPEIALLLLKGDYLFEIINLNEIFSSKNDIVRVKGRIIGSDGKTRRLVEELTECHISVYGKTVSIIGPAENVGVCRRSIEMIIKGSPHSTVYSWLERQRRDMKRRSYLSDDEIKSMAKNKKGEEKEKLKMNDEEFDDEFF